MSAGTLPRSLCVFCGSSPGRDPEHLALARTLGRRLATEGIALVYGGASVGLMGALADAALEAGGEVIGVIPRGLVAREVAHPALSELVVVDSMHERKAVMSDRAEGFVALPGGLGTLEELFEVWTWGLLGIHAKPVALLDATGYYDSMLGFLDSAMAEGFVREPQRGMLIAARSVDDLLAALRGWTAPTVTQWVTSRER